MLRSLMDSSNFSGSFHGAVYQQYVLHMLLSGNPIQRQIVERCSDGSWKCGESKNDIFDKTPALLIKYKMDGGFSNPVLIKDFLDPADGMVVKHDHKVVVFVAESQIFPSIDYSIASFDNHNKTVELLHTSVSIAAKHFAPYASSHNGHLPLNMTNDPPTILRSRLATKQMADYKVALLRHDFLNGFTVTYH
jgi:hypothetical protein